jgi:hypothetical protein
LEERESRATLLLLHEIRTLVNVVDIDSLH